MSEVLRRKGRVLSNASLRPLFEKTGAGKALLQALRATKYGGGI
ncbi:MAG TPA: hypothetical protein PK849_00795 [Synergistales bacterium]|nr:hypothetical protein [Synergistales bacterium]